MNKRLNIIIYMLLAVMAILLLWVIFFRKGKEIIFNIPTNIEVKVGSNYSIEYELNSELDVIWESENNNIVTVNNGIINGIGLGSTKVNGTVTNKSEKITKSIDVSTYLGEKDVTLNDVIIPEGELFISKGTTYELPISYEPYNSYIKKIEYSVINNNIVDFDGNIIAKEVGETDINIIVNDNITKTLKVNVVGEVINPTFTSRVNDIEIEEENITLTPGETKEIKYSVIPEKSYIKSIKWESSDSSIVDVIDGIVTAKASGESKVKLIINDNITKEISVTVIIPVTGLTLKSNPNLVLKVGETEIIKTTISPSNATNKQLKYTNSNPNSLRISDDGVIIALTRGTGTINISSVDGSKNVTVSYRVNPAKGLVNDPGGVWGYTSKIDKVPERADSTFFRMLASSGKGVLSDNIYTFNDGTNSYRYDISKSTLSSGSRSVLMRMYYPKDTDLSMVNTFTFCNGTGSGARGFSGILRALDEDRSKMKTSGIVILIASKDGTGYNQKEIILATEFVKSIVGQKSGVKNAVGAYSGSGEAVGYAGHNGGYDRVVIFNSYMKTSYNLNLKNKEIIIYSPNNDKLQDVTKSTISSMIRNGFTNVTIISNNSTIYNNSNYTSNYLVINPGSQMGSGHGYVNIPPTNVFSYACR